MGDGVITKKVGELVIGIGLLVAVIEGRVVGVAEL
jgi:hypothetical protein